MKTKTILAGTVVAWVSTFFLGWLIYGLVLSNIMTMNCDQSNARPEAEMIMWAIVASNFFWGLLLALIIYWKGIFTAVEGSKVGAVLGLLTALGFDLSMYSMTTFFLNMTAIVADSIAFSVTFAISGALAGWVMGRVNRNSARTTV